MTERPPAKKTKTNNHGDDSRPLVCVQKKLKVCSAATQVDPYGDTSLLQQLLGDAFEDTADFLDHCFQRSAVHIQTDAVEINRYSQFAADHLFGLDPLSLLQESSSENLFVWLQQHHTANTATSTTTNSSSSSTTIHSIEVSDADTAFRLYETGQHATYCRAPPPVEQALVPSLLRDTHMGRGEVELFLSARPSAVTQWHYDFQENFTLQLSGVKQWRLRRGTVPHPLRACTPHYQSPDVVESQLLAARLADRQFQFVGVPQDSGKDEVVVLLQPGDMLYFPAGMWHCVEVIEPGVSLNISLMATYNYASLTCQSLQHFLLQSTEEESGCWRQCVLERSRLDQMLQRLPDIVRDFVELYGVDAILPPALTPPILTSTNSSANECSNDMDDEDADSAMDRDDGDDGELDDDEAVEIVDVSKFPAPPHGFSRIKETTRMAKKLQQCRFVLNPLACILKKSTEIEAFYRGGTPSGNQMEDLVLNVNYAGNECHESLLRVVLRAPVGGYDDILQTISAIDATAPTVDWIQRNAKLLDCLIHFGFLLVKQAP